jgi:hypothetical protein
MTRHNETVWCDGCGVEIVWTPTVRAERDYCCEACVAGQACLCGERMELDSRRRARPDAEPGMDVPG